MAVFRAFASLIRLLMRVRDTHSNAVLQLLLGRRNMLTLEFTYSADYLAGVKHLTSNPCCVFGERVLRPDHTLT